MSSSNSHGKIAIDTESPSVKEGLAVVTNSNRPLTVEETAEALNLSQACIRAWISRRRIGCVRLGRAIRIPQTEIQRLLSEGSRPATRSAT
jgi:excisionase family DNA binding protein